MMTPRMGRMQLCVRAAENSRAQSCQGMGREDRGKVLHTGGDLAVKVAVAHGTGSVHGPDTSRRHRLISILTHLPIPPHLSQRSRNLGTLLILLPFLSCASNLSNASISVHHLTPASLQQPPYCLPASLPLALPLPVDHPCSSPQ